MVTLVSIVLAIKYLLCSAVVEKPYISSEQVSRVGWEMVPYDFQIDWTQRSDAPMVGNQKTDVK